jgi:hypothetical protein
MRFNEVARVIKEGGNAFKDAQGKILTTRINKAEVIPTVKWLEKVTGLPLANRMLGSTGKRPSSGDLDLAVDEKDISKDQLVAKLAAVADADSVVKSGISVHFKTPINGNPSHGLVQTDFMFTDDVPWLMFSMSAPGDNSQFTGGERNLLMSSIAKSLPNDLKYSWQKGLIVRSTGAPVTKSPGKIAAALLGNGHTAEDFYSVETILSALSQERLQALRDLMIKLRAEPGDKPAVTRANTEEAARLDKILSAIKN